jgi:peptidoglycan/LPS O-acetylase OafA/YrhL
MPSATIFKESNSAMKNPTVLSSTQSPESPTVPAMSEIQIVRPSSGKVIREDDRILALDGIRGIAILFVFLYHTKPEAGVSTINNAWYLICSPMWCGVEMFFVLSGFLITGILLNTKSHPRFFLNFYARRTLRIFPLYFGVLFVVFVVLPLAGAFPGSPLKKIVSGEYYLRLWHNQGWLWCYLSNFLQAKGPHQLPGFGHFWSLAIEEQFYLVWPLLVYFLTERGMLRLSIMIVICGVPMRWIMVQNGLEAWEIRHLTFSRIDTLAAGATVAILVRNCPTMILRRMAAALILTAIAGLVGMACVVPSISTHEPQVTVWGYTLFTLLFSGVILAASQDQLPHVMKRVLTHRILLFLGTLSYGIYVFHWPIVHGVHALAARIPKSIFLGSPFLLSFFELLLTFVFTMSIAMLSWRLYESRVLTLKRYFSYSRTIH